MSFVLYLNITLKLYLTSRFLLHHRFNYKMVKGIQLTIIIGRFYHFITLRNFQWELIFLIHYLSKFKLFTATKYCFIWYYIYIPCFFALFLLSTYLIESLRIKIWTLAFFYIYIKYVDPRKSKTTIYNIPKMNSGK